MEKILGAIRAVFPGFPPDRFSETLNLGDIPGWDSMSAVNFSVELEQVFKVDLLEEPLRERDTIGDLLQRLRKKGAGV